MVREEAISLVLGYVSIGSWLGAQFPQIIVNWRRKSVDGLALPFLANWLLGDTTNLIGCLLTDQLPFQTYLASYFVFVDICLVSQFLHYYAHRRTKSLSLIGSSSAQHSRASLIQHSPDTYSYRRARSSRSRSASHSLDPRLRSALANLTLTPSELDFVQQDSEVDAHGSQRRWRSRRSRRGSSLEGLPESVIADLHKHEWGGRRLTSLERDAEEEVEVAEAELESPTSVMIDSFHSEGGNRNLSRGRGKRVSWTRESPGRDNGTRRGPLLDEVEPLSAAPSTMRGRQLARPDMYDSSDSAEAPLLEAQLPRARRTSTASAVSAAASRRSASIVFLALFSLFTLSSYPVFRRNAGSEGRVLTMFPGSTSLIPDELSTPSDLLASSTPISFVPAPDVVLPLYDVEIHLSPNEETKRLIGRVSAWTCTTLYLTSRLPQIWKNFARKSVEGLSMYLFIFAFLGNFFYVLSIVTNPKMNLPAPLGRQFIRDSVPYLLGSGGTLFFDVTIVLQSFVYDPSRRVIHGRVRHRSLVAPSEDERRLLLSTDRHIEDAC